MKNKNGFTLVELLAVIVILAVIALIATPQVLGMIESARKGSAESSALSYVDSVEKAIVSKAITSSRNTNYDGNYTLNGNKLSKNDASLELDLKGDKPDSNAPNEVTVEKGIVKEAYLKFGEYYVTYKNNNNKISYCSNKEEYVSDCKTNEIKNLTYKEAILNGADPELYEGLIPIEISETGTIKYADPQTEWYKYADKKWANAVLVSNPTNYKVGDTISENDILMYYVWIPRYRYQLFNVDNSSISPFQIKIEFENKAKTKTNGTKNGDWLTHPAFTFGTTELNGFWVGKFETSGTTTALRIKPGVTSLRNINVATMFNASRNIDLSYSLAFNIDSKEVDTHMMKNMEWGAMAYLSHTQYGTCTNNTCSEIVYNSNSGYYTGGSSSKTAWATSSYTSESTTKNRYGIYDTSGGAWENVMGNMTSSTTVATKENFYNSSAGFSSVPEDKYIDYYTYNASDTGYLDHKRGKLGDATKETLATFGNSIGGWYADHASFLTANYSWFIRGGSYVDGTSNSGIFAFGYGPGAAGDVLSFRIVLSSE